ncbi:MAG: VOC family protein [Pseudomonadota bacterium]
MHYTESAFFSWNELVTADVEKAMTFYREVLGWTFEPMPMEDGTTYWVALSTDEPVAGLVLANDSPSASSSDHWFSYIEVEDVDARIEAVRSSSGQVLREPFDVPGVGRIAIVKDSVGAALGLMTSEEDDEEDEDATA